MNKKATISAKIDSIDIKMAECLGTIQDCVQVLNACVQTLNSTTQSTPVGEYNRAIADNIASITRYEDLAKEKEILLFEYELLILSTM